jgi:nucleotide-binding universal stress UspA family protein
MTGQVQQPPRPILKGAIVVGVDDSPNAAAAASFAQVLARRTGVACILVHAAEPGHEPVAAGLRVREALGQVRPPLALDDLEIHVGTPAEVLLSRAAQLDAQLVILGGKHHSLLGRWVAGSTAVSVIRRSTLPVLVTRGPVGIIDRILVGADATPASHGAIRYAEEWAGLWGAAVRVVFAVAMPPLLPEYSTGYDLALLQRTGEASAAQEIWPLIGREGTERIVEVGAAGQVLAEQARHWEAQLLVVARHDRGWMQRVAMGSVTERLLDGLPTSVLVVPATKTERAAERVVDTRKEVIV